jgi:hypothetical protein
MSGESITLSIATSNNLARSGVWVTTDNCCSDVFAGG